MTHSVSSQLDVDKAAILPLHHKQASFRARGLLSSNIKTACLEDQLKPASQSSKQEPDDPQLVQKDTDGF